MGFFHRHKNPLPESYKKHHAPLVEPGQKRIPLFVKAAEAEIAKGEEQLKTAQGEQIKELRIRIAEYKDHLKALEQGKISYDAYKELHFKIK